MVTEAWVQSDRHCATVHSAQPSGASARDPKPSECGGRGSLRVNNAPALISCNFLGEHSCSKEQKGRICNSKIVFSSVVNKYDYRSIKVDVSTNESGCQADTEKQLMLTKHDQVSNEVSDMKRGVKPLKSNKIARGTNTEMTSRPNTNDAASNEHPTNARPQSVDANEEQLFLDVLRGATPSTSTSFGEGSYKQSKVKDAKSLRCGDLSSVTDMQGIPWDTNAGTEFTKSAAYKTPEKHIEKSTRDVKRGRSNKSQNNKSQATPSYSDRYGIDSKFFPAMKKKPGNIGVQQHSAQNRPLSVRIVSGKVNHRMTATAGVESNREASIARRASVMNISLQCHNKVPNNNVIDEDASLTLDAQACLPVIKGREQKRPLNDDFVLDQPLTWKGCSNIPVDDVNNNREYKFQYVDTPWITHEPVPKDCTRGNTIILSVTPGANFSQGSGGKDHFDPVGSHDHESDLLLIKRFTSQATATNADLTGSRWSTLKYAIRCGQHTDITTSGPTADENVEGSASVQQHRVDTPKVRRPAPPKTVFRKFDKPHQTDAKNASTEGDGEPHAPTTSLIEDPILVKVSKRNRNVGKFTCKPDPLPNAVCFEISGTGLRHQDVKLQVESLLQKFPEVKIIGIQFHNRALVNNQREMNNRWIITTNTSEGCKLLVGSNLIFDGCEVQLRLYDEVVNTEYQQFVRMTNFVKMMDTRKILS